MPLALLAAGLVLHASPSWLVVPDDAEPSSEAAARAVMGLLVAQGREATLVPAGHALRACAETGGPRRASCVLKAAESHRVVLVGAAELGEHYAATVTALAPDGSVAREENGKGTSATRDTVLRDLVAALSSSLGPAREEPPVAKPPDAPVVTPSLEPRLPQEPVVAVTKPRPRTAAWVATGVTAAAVGVAVTFLALGLSQRSALEGAQPGQYPYSQALSLERDANTQLSVALGVGVGAAASAVLTGVLWGSAP